MKHNCAKTMHTIAETIPAWHASCRNVSLDFSAVPLSSSNSSPIPPPTIQDQIATASLRLSAIVTLKWPTKSDEPSGPASIKPSRNLVDVPRDSTAVRALLQIDRQILGAAEVL